MQSMVHVHFDFEELQVDEYGYKMAVEIPGLYYWFEEALHGEDSKSSSLSEITNSPARDLSLLLF